MTVVGLKKTVRNKEINSRKRWGKITAHFHEYHRILHINVCGGYKLSHIYNSLVVVREAIFVWSILQINLKRSKHFNKQNVIIAVNLMFQVLF